MNILLEEYDFSIIHEDTVDCIKDTCMLFQDMKVSDGFISGESVNYWISHIKDGIEVQVTNKYENNFRCGVLIFIENNKLSIHPYNNQHYY